MSWSELRQRMLIVMPELDETLCIIPIWPAFADQIYCGSKCFEFRKRMPRKGVTAFLIYETAPISAVTGRFVSGRVFEDNPKSLWAATAKGAGISEQDFFRYYGSCQLGVAISISETLKFDSPIPLADFGCNPPQSYVYI
ncbi:hypothetical protein [Nitratidesulfovibrio vulgaris]|uniref:hypothetical protein n=1 Tax=Nitratidesulfovibrio vulgaris TaxID=881 RepID=UPI002301A190|nr:hypothetical protein [Nitratidesulfovibrio vulgaris]WCB46640.1 hypothetical protein PH214_00710 [Nitratidesulfovibrio vulgaris]